MKKKFFSLALSGVLLCSVAAPALGAGRVSWQGWQSPNGGGASREESPYGYSS